MATLSSPALKALRNAAIGIVGHLPFAQHALAEKLAELDPGDPRPVETTPP